MLSRPTRNCGSQSLHYFWYCTNTCLNKSLANLPVHCNSKNSRVLRLLNSHQAFSSRSSSAFNEGSLELEHRVYVGCYLSFNIPLISVVVIRPFKLAAMPLLVWSTRAPDTSQQSSMQRSSSIQSSSAATLEKNLGSSPSPLGPPFALTCSSPM